MTPTPHSPDPAFAGPQPHQRAPEPCATDALTVALSHEASPLPSALGERLRRRLAAHRDANAALHTLRQPQQGQPETWAPGVRAWPLSAGRSWRLALEAGARLPPRAVVQELLVLAGTLHLGPHALPAQGHALAGPQTLWQAGPEGAQLYLRDHAAGPFTAPPTPQLQGPDAAAWQPLRPGVHIRPLHGEGPAMSLLARFEPGACVPAHPHGIDEECLMVEGDLFLGDVLLRQGGFQAAPAGSAHGDLVADGPCLLFFHGAIDAAAIDNAHRQAEGWPAL